MLSQLPTVVSPNNNDGVLIEVKFSEPLHESPKTKGLLAVGTDDGLVHISSDGGANWTKLDKLPGIPELTFVNDVKWSQHSAEVLYVVFNNHKNGDFKPYVLVTKNRGKTWETLSTGLPQRGSAYVLAEDHIDASLLFVGTEFGAFTSTDAGLTWTELKKGLPTVAVRDIAIQQREDDLVLATFGRGFYVLDDYSPLREIKNDIKNSTTLSRNIRFWWFRLLTSQCLTGCSKTAARGY